MNVVKFNDLIFSFLGLELTDNQKAWFAADGKELRGSITKGETRGQAVVQVVEHKTRKVYAQDFYNGMKESERPCVCSLLKGNLRSQKITLDALHLIPETVKQIEQQNGIFLIGIKENQKELLEETQFITTRQKPIAELQKTEKEHGRIDSRTYAAYTLNNACFEQRWDEANFQTIIKVERESYNCKKKTQSAETSYYISNQKIKPIKNDFELFNAVREHWNVETNNHIRDVTFKEDNLKTKEPLIARNIATCRTILLNLIYQLNPKNIRAQLEEFADNFQILLQWLTQIKFL